MMYNTNIATKKEIIMTKTKKIIKDIPVLHVKSKGLAQTYELALLELKNYGIEFSTQYDKPGDPKSLDATMNITIEDPLSDPMIHKAFPGGISDLREYVFELQGYKDDFIKNIDDENDHRWLYTYSGRFKHYGSTKRKINNDELVYDPQYLEKHSYLGKDGIANGSNIDQVQYVIDKLSAQPFTRQAQMITWDPSVDLNCYDPACCQSLWFRILEDSEGINWLNTNIRFRSNDAWGAFFMNAFGFIHFVNDIIVKGVAEKTGKVVKMGRLNWQADSWHIYGKDLAQANERLFNRIYTTSFEDRVYYFNDPMIQEMYYENDATILKKIEETRNSFSKG